MQTELSRQNTSRSYTGSLSHCATSHLSSGVLSFPRVSGGWKWTYTSFLVQPTCWPHGTALGTGRWGIGGSSSHSSALDKLCKLHQQSHSQPLEGVYLDSFHTTAAFFPALSESLRLEGFLLQGRREQSYQGPHVLNALCCRTTYKKIQSYTGLRSLDTLLASVAISSK